MVHWIYSFGRHSKSIDTERKCCGYCHGKFELLINKELKNGSTQSVPVTKKAPNAFALYVKQNYSILKKPNLQHGDVMRMLGERFAQIKVQNKGWLAFLGVWIRRKAYLIFTLHRSKYYTKKHLAYYFLHVPYVSANTLIDKLHSKVQYKAVFLDTYEKHTFWKLCQQLGTHV